MATPIASATLTVDNAGLQPVVTAVCVVGGYMVIRLNSGNALAILELAFSSDGGTHFQVWPDPLFVDPTIMIVGWTPPPYFFPTRRQRGANVRVRAQSTVLAGTNLTVEIYEPAPTVPNVRGGVPLP